MKEDGRERQDLVATSGSIGNFDFASSSFSSRLQFLLLLLKEKKNVGTSLDGFFPTCNNQPLLDLKVRIGALVPSSPFPYRDLGSN